VSVVVAEPKPNPVGIVPSKASIAASILGLLPVAHYLLDSKCKALMGSSGTWAKSFSSPMPNFRSSRVKVGF
jgi:hypothetical protein